MVPTEVAGNSDQKRVVAGAGGGGAGGIVGFGRSYRRVDMSRVPME